MIDGIENAEAIIEILKAELLKRKQKNSRYSMRSFAQLLGTEVSSLSRVISGQRIPSPKWTLEILNHLGYSADESQKIVAQMVARKKTIKEIKDAKFSPVQDEFTEVNSWIHYVLLEVMNVFRVREESVPVIAGQLACSEKLVQQALHELVKWDMAECVGGDYRPSQRDTTTTRVHHTTESLRAIQKIFLKMSADAVDKYSLDKRENTTLTVSISQDQFSEIKEILKKTRQRVNKVSARNLAGQSDAVYNLTMALYPVFFATR